MLKKLLLAMSVMAVASGFAMGPTVARAGMVEVAPNMVGGGREMLNDQPFVEVWTDRGTGAVYSPGERVDVYMRPAYDCFVIVYDIDTDGNLRLLFPYDSRDDGLVRGGEIYRLGMGGYGGYYVTGPSGVEYVHVLSSFEPFRPIYWHGQAGYAAHAQDASWRGFSDYWGAAVPPRVYGDPYVAMQSIDEFICYDALEAGIASADFTYFYVEHQVSYPRYLCYDCHGYQPAFHPYVDVCSGFHISFVACDPCYKPCSWWWWCSPKRVYCGPTYVCNAKKPCKKYPELYKWRTRCDSYAGRGTSYGDYYKERVRPGGGQSANGRTAEVVRVRPEREKRPEGNAKERDLYSRESSRESIRNREAVRTVPARVERPRVDDRKIEVPRVESRKVKRESGWSKLVKVVQKTIERKSGGKTRSEAGSEAGTSRASDAKSRKTETDPKTVKIQVSREQKSKQVSDRKSSGESGKSGRDASKARTTSKVKTQSTRRRVSD